MDLLLQGSHNKLQKAFHLQQSNIERLGKFSFANRLNDITYSTFKGRVARWKWENYEENTKD